MVEFIYIYILKIARLLENHCYQPKMVTAIRNSIKQKVPFVRRTATTASCWNRTSDFLFTRQIYIYNYLKLIVANSIIGKYRFHLESSHHLNSLAAVNIKDRDGDGTDSSFKLLIFPDQRFSRFLLHFVGV